MLKSIRDIPIKRKVTLVILIASMATLLLASVSLFLFQWFSARQTIRRDLQAQAEIIGANSTAALTFQDQKAATEMLLALKAKPRILGASLYLPDGNRLAFYGDESLSFSKLENSPPQGLVFDGPHLLLYRPVILDHRHLGTLHLRFDSRAMEREIINPFLIIMGCIVLAAFLPAILLSSAFQRVISTPILSLASTARAIADKKDYSVRADQAGRDEIGTLTQAFNQMLGRIQEQDTALRHSEAQKQTILSAIQAGIVIIDAQTHDILYANDTALNLIGHSREHVVGRNCHTFICPAEAGKCPITDLHATVDNSERVLLNSRGQRIPILKSVVPITFLGRPSLLEFFLDNTERKRAEAELHTLHQRLLETSRLAGMAEVATGVLHNVGNVLNSVNVSCTLVVDRVRQSKVANLPKLAAMIAAQNGNLGEFLTQDPKGKQIPGYLCSLVPVLMEEQLFALKELHSLRDKIDHIKEIVAMQQNYARISGVIETLPITHLVEDALKLNTGALARHGVGVERQFDDVPPVAIDKHKVLQILLNLIRNAKYACDEGGLEPKLVTLRVYSPQPDRVAVQIIDNGIGIPPENLTKIFAHGFTTRAGGHGFGLHSGALAAKELGGSLTAHSEGLGKGAVFTLELPVKSNAVMIAAAPQA